MLANRPVADFVKPDTVVSVPIDASTGCRAKPDSPEYYDEYFISGSEPTEQCDEMTPACDKCQSTEQFLSQGSSQNGTATMYAPGDKTDPFFLWPTGTGQGGWFYAFYTDVKTAVHWLRAHAGVYHLDPSWFAAWGDSAGGYLASMLGTSAGIPELEGTELGWAGHSSALQAVMDWYGPTDMLLMDRQLREAGLYFKDGPDHDAPDSPESRLVGFPIQEQPERLRLANPITYIRKEVPPPPFLIYHGSRDRIVPAGQSRILVEALLPQLGPQRLVVDLSMPVDHGGQPDFYLPANIERMLNFLDRSLGR